MSKIQLHRSSRPSPGEIAQLKSLFKHFDVDNSGYLSNQELTQLLAAIGVSLGSSQIDNVMSTLDVDNDGAISFSELLDYFRSLVSLAQSMKTEIEDGGGVEEGTTRGGLEALLPGVSSLRSGADGSAVAVSSLEGRPTMFYFSAQFCPPCRQFTPQLAEYYKALDGRANIIWCTMDRDEGSYNDYVRHHPWLALNFKDRNAGCRLAGQFSVRGIPALVVVSPSGDVLNTDAVGVVMADPKCERFPFGEGGLPKVEQRQAPAPVAAKKNASASPASAGDDLESMIKECLDSHNHYRKAHGAEPLAWDNKCYETSVKWANHMAEVGKMYHGGHDGMGQNLAWSSGNNLTVAHSVQMWYDEVTDPGYDFSKPTFSCGTGHFTQVVWRGTTHVGVAVAKHPKHGTYVCANYSPPGNYMGRFAENVLKAGSEVKPLEKPKPKSGGADRPPMDEAGAAAKIQANVRGHQSRQKMQDFFSPVSAASDAVVEVSIKGGSTAPSAEFTRALDKIPEHCDKWKKGALEKIQSAPNTATISLSVADGMAKLVTKQGGCTSSSAIMWG
eukprot:PhM_4_TR2639/c0_g1_i1/m.13564